MGSDRESGSVRRSTSVGRWGCGGDRPEPAGFDRVHPGTADRRPTSHLRLGRPRQRPPTSRCRGLSVHPFVPLPATGPGASPRRPVGERRPLASVPVQRAPGSPATGPPAPGALSPPVRPPPDPGAPRPPPGPSGPRALPRRPGGPPQRLLCMTPEVRCPHPSHARAECPGVVWLRRVAKRAASTT